MKIEKEISLFTLYRKILLNFRIQRSFILFKRPYEKKIFLYSHDKKNNGSGPYFVFQDFYQEKRIKIIPHKIYYIALEKYSPIIYKPSNISFDDIDFNDVQYKKLLHKTMQAIKEKLIKKIVISKYIQITYHNICLKNTFKNLIFSYPYNLNSIWYNKDNIWISSTPELLMQCDGNILHTVSLAGTTLLKKKWGKKEIKEHKFVTEYMVSILEKNYSGFLHKDRTANLNIGYFKHLQTKISFYFFRQPDYYNIIKRLYPTPSICGLPKNRSFSFIKKNEGYIRNFYTGYMGIINEPNEIELYINIRCVQIYKDKIILYAGSGITEMSNINKECIETNNKIKSILYNLFFL